MYIPVLWTSRKVFDSTNAYYFARVVQSPKAATGIAREWERERTAVVSVFGVQNIFAEYAARKMSIAYEDKHRSKHEQFNGNGNAECSVIVLFVYLGLVCLCNPHCHAAAQLLVSATPFRTGKVTKATGCTCMRDSFVIWVFFLFAYWMELENNLNEPNYVHAWFLLN